MICIYLHQVESKSRDASSRASLQQRFVERIWALSSMILMQSIQQDKTRVFGASVQAFLDIGHDIPCIPVSRHTKIERDQSWSGSTYCFHLFYIGLLFWVMEIFYLEICWILFESLIVLLTMLLRCLRHSSGRGSLGNVIQALDQSTGQLFAVKEAHRVPPIPGPAKRYGKVGKVWHNRQHPDIHRPFFFTKEELSRACIPLILILYEIMYCDILGINAFMTFHQWAPWVWASFWPLPGLDQHIRCGRC